MRSRALIGAAVLALLGGVAVMLVRRPVDVGAPPAAASSAPVLVGENHWRVPARSRSEYLSDRTRLNRDLRLKPVAGAGADAVSDLRIDRVEPGGPMYAAGFREGDRILKVNGLPVTTLSRAVNLVHEAEAASCLTVQVERQGKVLDYEFEFR